jgi:hypothetical protein
VKVLKEEFLSRTLALWQPRTSRQLTHEDTRQIAENMVGFFALLHEWSVAERSRAHAHAEALENN